jgi:transcriptional regulator with XRE-family HTH domain
VLVSTNGKRSTYPFDRLVDGIEEARLEFGLSRATIAQLAGVTAEMVRNLERGNSRNWRAAVKLRIALTVLELSAPPKGRESQTLVQPKQVLVQPTKQVLVQPNRGLLKGAS